MDETILVRCSWCKGNFRDGARRVRDGHTRQCPSCERMLFFTEGSQNKDIQNALRDAHRVRKLLDQEGELANASNPSAGLSAPRRLDRRVHPGGGTATEAC